MSIDLNPGDRLDFDGLLLLHHQGLGDGLLQITRLDTGGPFQVEDPITGQRSMPDEAWVEETHRQGRLRIIRPERPAATPLPECDAEAILSKDPNARFKLFVVRELVRHGASRSDRSVASKLEEIFTPDVVLARGPKPPCTTARRWLRKHGGFDVRLVDVMSRTGTAPRRSRLDPFMKEQVAEAARWFYVAAGNRQKDSEARVEAARVKENVRRVQAGGGEPQLAEISRETVRRAIRDIRCRDTLTEKYGKDWARRQFDGSGCSLRTVRFLQVALMDDQEVPAVFCFDAETRLPVGKPWLCLIIDVETRCVLGWFVSYGAPTVHSAVECIRKACVAKTIRPDTLGRWPVLRRIFGLPGEIITDNGSNYASPAFQDVLNDIGITLRLAKVHTPTHRAIVERVFLSLQTMLVDKLPGNAPDIATMREAGYDPDAHALLTITEFEALLVEWINLYHVTVHSGIGMQPARAWETQLGRNAPTMLADPSQLAIMLGDTETCRLTRNGVRLNHQTYRSREGVGELLDDLCGQGKVGKVRGTASATVKVRYSPADLGEIRVWNQRSKRYVVLPAANQRYARGMSLHAHLQIRAWAKKENRAFSTESEQLLARDALNELVKELVPEVANRERRAIARLLGSQALPRLQKGVPPVAEADPRHDGLGPVAGTEPFAHEREDGGALTGRPVRTTPPEPEPSPLQSDDSSPQDDADGTDADDWYDDDQAGGDAGRETGK